jgi:hypothetical protein
MTPARPLDLARDADVIRLAKEVAIDHHPIADILTRYNIDEATWDALNEWPRFKELVDHERQQWNSALNTNTRVRLKSSTIIEEWMEEGYRLLHDAKENFSAKIELIKLFGKFSGLDAQEKVIGETATGRVTINIKIGDQNVEYQEGPVLEAIPIVEPEADPDQIDYDWDQEFPVAPTEDADEFFATAAE